jgi:hypothetical protein
MQSEPLNTVAIQQFISQVKSADAGQSRDVTLNIQQAKRLAFTLGEVMTRMNGDLEALIIKKNNTEEETIEVRLDGGNSW